MVVLYGWSYITFLVSHMFINQKPVAIHPLEFDNRASSQTWFLLLNFQKTKPISLKIIHAIYLWKNYCPVMYVQKKNCTNAEVQQEYLKKLSMDLNKNFSVYSP